MKRTLLEKLGDFVLGKGFYIVLFLCVATIGISGYYLIQTLTPAGTSAPVTGNPTVTLPDESTVGTVQTPPMNIPSIPTHQQSLEQPDDPQPQRPAEPEQPEEDKPSEPASNPSSPAPAVYTWPVRGAVIGAFNVDTLAYDETMGDWRTHAGVDLNTAVGTQVLALREGQVTRVEHSDLMGSMVTIDHGDGMISRYANLAENPGVVEGDRVAMGDVIGEVGETALAESKMEPHLHLEVLVNGVPQDPMNYIPKT